MKERNRYSYFYISFHIFHLNVTNEHKNLDSIKHNEPSTNACVRTNERELVCSTAHQAISALEKLKFIQLLHIVLLDPIANYNSYYSYYHYYCLKSFKSGFDHHFYVWMETQFSVRKCLTFITTEAMIFPCDK